MVARAKYCVMLCAVLVAFLLAAEVASALPYDWAMSYEHVNQHGGGYKFSLRGLAAAQDGTLYYGHIQNAYDGVLPGGTLNIVHCTPSGSIINYITVSAQPKALAADDRGYVYAGAGGSVNVYPGNLASLTKSIAVSGATAIEGLTIDKEGANYFLYASNRSTGKVARYDITDIDNPVLDTLWAAGGIYTLPTTDLRGVAVDHDGNIWVADKANDLVYKIAADGLSYTSAIVDNPMDIAICPIYAYITCQEGNQSTVEQLLMSDMSFQQSLYNPMVNTGYANHYGFGGVDIIGGKLYLTDEDSWRIDGLTGYGDPLTSYGDRIFSIDIPSCAVPEPGTIAMILVGLGAGFARFFSFRAFRR